MTDPLALEPILGPRERGRPGFKDDLPHHERFALSRGSTRWPSRLIRGRAGEAVRLS